jgi:signal transduction histidine kinase
MAWGIGSNKPSNSMFLTLRWRLLLSYLGVMVAIVGTSFIAVYEFTVYNLYQKRDLQLATLADAAAHSLHTVKANRTAIDVKYPRKIDYDGDLDIPWQDLRGNHQSVEWFDDNRRSLGEAGQQFPKVPFAKNFHVSQQGQIRSLTIPVYESKNSNRKLIGYIRVSESTEDFTEELDRLAWGLEWGGIIAVILSTGGASWLTKQSLKPIEQSFEQLKQFTADASHELRSPLTAIKTSVEVMQSHPERIHLADVKKLNAIAGATKQMSYLVEDLLLLARNDGTVIKGDSDWVSIPLDELLEDLLDLLSPSAEAKGISLKSEISQEVFVKGNANFLKRLFSNLLENALQYTPDGGTVRVSIFSFDNKFTIVRVEDTGIGIAPEHIPLVFNRFWRADKARSSRSGGLGLGLAIASAIAHSHGGEISVRSQISMGSCFQVKLPVLQLGSQ